MARKPKRGETQLLYDPDAPLPPIETVLESGWMVVQHLEMQNGRRVVAELRIFPAPPTAKVRDGRNLGERPTDGIVPPGGITARLLRQIEVGKHEAFLADYRSWIAKCFGPEALARFDRHDVHPRRPRRAPKRQRASDRYYAELARDYVRFVEQPPPPGGIRKRKPIDQLAIMRDEAPQRIRSHVHLARRNGFLTETRRGEMGGELTAKAKRVLSVQR